VEVQTKQKGETVGNEEAHKNKTPKHRRKMRRKEE
jgi:hypothetical protein